MISTRNSWYLLIWLTTMCIPWCCTIENSKSIPATSDIILLGGISKLNDALDYKFIMLNGELLNLRELYDDILPTAKNFKIGQYLLSSLFKKIETISEKSIFPKKPLAGEKLTQRKLYSLETDQSKTVRATTIAQNIAMGSGSKSSSITAIVGPSHSGKSVLLDFIDYKFRELKPAVWTFNIDLSETFSSWNKLNFNEINSLNYNDFIKQIIRTEFHELFNNLLEINPKRIAIFIDSLDKMSRSIERKVVSIVKTLAEKGVVTVVAGSQTTLTSLQSICASTKAWEIREMNFYETKEFLKNIWISRISTQANIDRLSAMPSQSTINLRLDNYASTVASLLLQRTSLYRQPATLIQLARTFQNIDSLNSFNYALEKFPSSSSLASIQHVSLIKKQLYETFIISLMHDRENLISLNTYGVIALAQIIQQVESPKEYQRLLNNIKAHIKDTEDTIKNENLRTIYAEILSNEKIQFIHPDFQYYFASQFIINENIPQLNSLMIKIYSNPSYGKILEFINSEIPMVISDQLSLILQQTDLKLKSVILDNALIHGYENVFLQIVKKICHMDGIEEIKKYFNAKNIPSLKRVKRTFGLIEPTFQSIDNNVGTRMELLAENNMIRTFKTLQSFKGKFSLAAAEYQDLLTIIATRAKPNIEFVKLLITQADSESVKMNFDNALIQLIDFVGEEADYEVIKLLKSHCSAGLLKNSAQSQTLLHLSIKWNNVNFLEFINNEFGTFSIDKNIFLQALDSNPSPLFTPPGWWEKMHWLIERSTDHPLIFNRNGDMKRDVFRIPIEDADKSWFKLILGTQNSIQKSATNWLDIVSVQLDRKNLVTSLSDEDLSQLQYSNLREWGLSAKTLALRRNLLMQQLWEVDSSITPVEILVNYRGVNQLSQSEHYFYRHTVAQALKHNEKLLNTKVRNRIFNTLVDNIGNSDDLKDLEFLLHQNLLQESADKIRTKLKLKLESRSSTTNALDSRKTALSVRERLLNLRVVHNSELENIEKFKDEVNNVLQFFNSDAGPPVPICLASRVRRRLSTSSIECRYSWKDIDQFSENPGNRVISKIQINSNKFVNMLSYNEFYNPIKSNQLLGFIRQMQHENTIKSKFTITGTLKMLLRDILKHGSIQSYHHYQRKITIMNNLVSPSSDWKKFLTYRRLISSRSLVLYAFGMIPLIRQLMATVSACFDQKITHNDDCFYTSVIVGISTTAPITNHAITKYMPWMVDRIAEGAQIMLHPVSAAKFISQNIKAVQHLSRKFGVYIFSGGLAILGFGLDVYNVVEMSKMIYQCKKQPSECSDKERIDNIISLTFSCISIAVTVGLTVSVVGIQAEMAVIGTLILLETLALALNEVIHLALYYDTHYYENLRTFVNKFTFQSPPQQIQDLVRYTNWVDKLRDITINFLNESQNDIVAYAVGIGKFKNDNITSAHSIINMNNSSFINTHGISRIVPRKKTGITALCLSKISRQNTYEDGQPKTIKSAIYECENAFVLANKTRWKNARVGYSSIVYNLQNINSGDITGSSLYNNLFLIFNSNENLRVIGGGGNVTNIFTLRTDGFRGEIILHHRNTKNVIDLSTISTSGLTFYWKASSGNGWISYGGNFKISLSRISVSKNTIPHLHVVGRVGKSDIFICNWCNQFGCQTAKETITIDSGGGKSQYDMDQVKNCKFSVLNPFTRITGDKLYGVTYTTYVNLGGSSYKTTLYNISTIAYATIEPQNSDFAIFFSNGSFLHSITEVTYDINTKDLVLTLQYKESMLLILTIKPYYALRPMELNKNNTDYKNTVTCILVDNYNNLKITPIIDKTNTSTGVISLVTRFDIFATVNSSRLVDIMDHYLSMQFNEIQYFIAVIKFVNLKTNQSFIYGSHASDRFYVDETTVFLFGNEGADIYMINKNIRQHVWIDNSASDSITDTLIISDEICDSMRFESGPIDSDLSDGSIYDVTIVCSHMKITLQNYLVNIYYQHLRILWKNGIYTLIAYHCQDCTNKKFIVEMAIVFSFEKSWQSVALTLTSDDKALAIYNADIETNPLAVYRSGLFDVIVTKKYLDSQRPSFIVLRNFLTVNPDSLHRVAFDWQSFRIFLINGSVGDDINNPKILNHDEIFNLIDVDHHNNDPKDGDFIQEYIINFDGPDRMKNLTIFHNKNSRNDRLGILLINGAKPTEVKGWSHGSSFIYKIKNIFITVINWCLPTTRHRFYQMEFIGSYDEKPVIIHNLHHLDCDSNIGQALNEKLKNAQSELYVNDSDKSRLMFCVTSFLTDILLIRNISNANNFFFTLTAEEHIFTQDNCQILFTRNNLETITRRDMKKTLDLKFKRMKLSGIATAQEIEYLNLVNLKFQKINDYCWKTFIFFLWNRSDAIGELNFNYIRHIVNSLASCNVLPVIM